MIIQFSVPQISSWLFSVDGTSFRLLLKTSPLPIGPVASNTGPSSFPSGASCYDTASPTCPVIPAYLRTLVCMASLDFARSSYHTLPMRRQEEGRHRSVPDLFCPNMPFRPVDKSPCCLAHGGQEEGTDQPSWYESAPSQLYRAVGTPASLLCLRPLALLSLLEKFLEKPCPAHPRGWRSLLCWSPLTSLWDSFRTLAHWQHLLSILLAAL